MDKYQQEQKRFLEEQIEWCKKQDCILEEIEEKLYEMKELAECAHDNELTPLEIDKLKRQFKQVYRAYCIIHNHPHHK